MLEDFEIYEFFKLCKKLGALPQVHAENGHLVDKGACASARVTACATLGALTACACGIAPPCNAGIQDMLSKGVHGPEGHEMSRPEEVSMIVFPLVSSYTVP